MRLKRMILSSIAAATIGVCLTQQLEAGPLQNAASSGSLEALQHLLDSGVSVNTVDGTGTTALMVAAFRGNTDVVSHLLEAGADMNLPNSSGSTALIEAANFSCAEAVVARLLHAGADVNIANHNGETALHRAVMHGHTKIVSLLLEAHADPHHASNDGKQALERAAEWNRPETAEAIQKQINKRYMNTKRALSHQES